MSTSPDVPDGGEIVFLVPAIHDLQTGGNVYNRRIVEQLRPKKPVQVVAWSPDEAPASDLALSGADVLIVDSLLAQHPEALRTVKEAAPAAMMVLVVHYLRCVDPSVTNGDTGANERVTLTVVDGAIATSRFVKRSLEEEGVPPEREAVVQPGLDERYRGALPLRMGMDPPRILTVANLLPEKGLQLFVEVLRDLRDLPWTWTLVGDASLDPEYAAGVFRRIRAAGLTDRVMWTGPIAPEALRTGYDRADLFAVPSRFETCSLSTREAMARGLPVVGYRVGGIAENFGGAAAGHLVPPGNGAALRAALRSLLTDPLSQRRKGIAAWRRSHEFPKWEEAADRFLNALASLHARPPTGTP